MIAKFLTDAAWFFFIFWLPKYLGDVRALDIKQIGYFAWIPYAFAGAGSLMRRLAQQLSAARRSCSLNASRKIALGLSASLLPASLFIVASPLSTRDRLLQHGDVRASILVGECSDAARRSFPRARRRIGRKACSVRRARSARCCLADRRHACRISTDMDRRLSSRGAASAGISPHFLCRETHRAN